MDVTPDHAADPEGARPQARRRDVEVRVHRAPKYGVFMVIGAIVGALVAWLVATLQPTALNEGGQPVDTSAVIGLIVVIGFVLGLAAGGIVALLADRAMRRRGHTLTAEQIDVEAPAEPEPPREQRSGGAPADAGEVAFERIDPLTGESLPDARGERGPQRSGESLRDERDGADRPRPGDAPEEHDRADRA